MADEPDEDWGVLRLLADLQETIRGQEDALAWSRQSRHDLIKSAIEQGHGPTDIARAAGISRQAVYDIINAPH